MKMAYLKNLCLFISITAMSAFADTSFTIHWPHHGDRVMKTHYEFVDVPSDTTIWDFSHAIETGERHEMHWVSIGDSLWVKIEQGVQSINYMATLYFGMVMKIHSYVSKTRSHQLM